MKHLPLRSWYFCSGRVWGGIDFVATAKERLGLSVLSGGSGFRYPPSRLN